MAMAWSTARCEWAELSTPTMMLRYIGRAPWTCVNGPSGWGVSPWEATKLWPQEACHRQTTAIPAQPLRNRSRRARRPSEGEAPAELRPRGGETDAVLETA